MTALTFQTTTLSVINQQNQIWLSTSDISKALGYNRSDNLLKLYNAHADEFTPCMTRLIDMPTSGGLQKVRVFSLRGAHLIGMLSHTKVAKDFRKWVLDILEQETSKAPQANAPEKISEQHRAFIKDLVMENTKRLPKEHQAKAAIMQWSALKTHFGKSYKELDDSQFVEAVSLISRLPLEGELIIDEIQALPQAKTGYHFELTEQEMEHLVWLYISANQSNVLLKDLYEPLEKIGSNFAPAVYSHHHEYKHCIKSSLPVMKRLLEPFKQSNELNWQRATHLLTA